MKTHIAEEVNKAMEIGHHMNPDCNKMGLNQHLILFQ